LNNTISGSISRHSVEQIINAFAFAEYNSNPFTAFFAIAWEKTDNWCPDQLPERQELFARALRRWLEKHGLPCAYVYTVENGQAVGLHTNVAVHIPRKLFKTFLCEASSLVPGFNGDPLTVGFFKDRRSGRVQFHFHPNQRRGSLKYMLKGVDPDASFNSPAGRVRLCDHLNLRPIPQGTVTGRRTGVSHCLGKEARARAGWTDQSAPDALKTALAYIRKPEVAV
jgi:hypothetical protein